MEGSATVTMLTSSRPVKPANWVTARARQRCGYAGWSVPDRSKWMLITYPGHRSGLEPIGGPAVVGPLVAQPAVQPVGAGLPELDRLGREQVAQPGGGARQRPA